MVTAGCGGGSTPAKPANSSEVASPGSASVDVIEFEHAGHTRRAVVYRPASAPPKSPLVLAFHGGGGNADGTRGAYELEPVADKEGFVIVYPEGAGKKVLGKHFAVWGVDTMLDQRPETEADDVGFVAELLRRLERRGGIDAQRVYAMGLSNGSMMAMTLACELSDQIAAVVGTGGTLHGTDCTSSRAVPTLYVAGEKDPCWPYAGGRCAGCWQKAMKEAGLRRKPVEYATCDSLETFEDGWSRHLGCVSEPTPLPHPGGASCHEYSTCADDAVFRVCAVPDLGHVWPGADYGGCAGKEDGKLCGAYVRAVGPKSDTLDLSREGWEFVKQFSLGEQPAP